jgi:hypothetical protein
LLPPFGHPRPSSPPFIPSISSPVYQEPSIFSPFTNTTSTFPSNFFLPE